MASAVITFKNDNTGEVKSAPVGFSYTALSWSFLPMVIRRDWKWAAIVAFLSCITGAVVSNLAPNEPVFVFLNNLVFGFIYNKLYIKELISKGYNAVSWASASSFDDQMCRFIGRDVDKGELKDVIAKLGIDIPAKSDGESQTPKQVEDKVVEETSGEETELKRIEDMYEKSLINDEERKAMREKVLGLE